MYLFQCGSQLLRGALLFLIFGVIFIGQASAQNSRETMDREGGGDRSMNPFTMTSDKGPQHNAISYALPCKDSPLSYLEAAKYPPSQIVIEFDFFPLSMTSLFYNWSDGDEMAVASVNDDNQPDWKPYCPGCGPVPLYDWSYINPLSEVIDVAYGSDSSKEIQVFLSTPICYSLYEYSDLEAPDEVFDYENEPDCPEVSIDPAADFAVAGRRPVGNTTTGWVATSDSVSSNSTKGVPTEFSEAIPHPESGSGGATPPSGSSESVVLSPGASLAGGGCAQAIRPSNGLSLMAIIISLMGVIIVRRRKVSRRQESMN